MFAIHPSTKVIQSLTYDNLLDGEPYVSEDSRNGTEEPENLVPSLTLTNALVGIHFKHHFQSSTEITGRADITI